MINEYQAGLIAGAGMATVLLGLAYLFHKAVHKDDPAYLREACGGCKYLRTCSYLFCVYTCSGYRDYETAKGGN